MHVFYLSKYSCNIMHTQHYDFVTLTAQKRIMLVANDLKAAT